MSGESRDTHRRVRLFRYGRNEVVRTPREYELPRDEAILRKEGDRLILEPAPSRSILAVLADLEPLDEDFPLIDEIPPEAVDL
jgi:antitoxin VapB